MSVDTLLSGISDVSSEPSVVTACKSLIDKFREVFRLFAVCHNAYNGRTTDDTAIKQLGIYNHEINTTKYVPFVPLQRRTLRPSCPIIANFPEATILPKMHLLEDHMVGWLKRFHAAAGLMGEQGAESIHAHLNRLETTYCGITNGVERLKYVFKM